MVQGKRRPRRRLFWRIYLYGVLLLVLVAVAAVVTAFLFDSRFPASEITGRLSRLVAAQLSRALEQPRALRARLRDIQYVLQADVAVYRGDGTLVSAAGEAPPPLPPEEVRSLAGRSVFHGKGRRGMTVAVALQGGGGAYLLISHQRGHGGLLKLATMLGLILALMALASLPLARTISRPLERITDTAAAIGRGDLSARTQLRRSDEVGHLAQVLDEMAARLEHSVQAEKELWANISHELRTPLSRIRVALELCEEEQDATRIRDQLAGIADDISELDRLVGDVLMNARLDLAGQTDGAGGFVLRRQPLLLAEQLEAAVARFARAHPGHSVQLELEPDLPQLEADPALLSRVLGNLLDNAAKYSDGEATEVRLSEQAGQQLVEVRDRGPGIAEEDLPRLFDHFFRADRSRSRGTGGTGLGLTLCKRIIEAHGGSILARNRHGGGLVVQFGLGAK